MAGRRGRRVLLALTSCFSLALGTARAQAPANDNPCGAVVLTPQGSLCAAPTTSTNAQATTTVPNGYANPSATQTGCGAGGAAPKDVWFSFTTAATGPASFGAALTVTGNAAGMVRLYAAPSCTGPFTEIQCSSSGQANTVAPRLATGALQASTTYYVQVAGYADTDPTGAFTICLTDGPGQPTCGTPTLGTPTYPSTTTATIPLTLGVNNTFPVTVLVTGPGGFSQTTTATGGPLQLSGLRQGTTYTVSVTAPCSASGQAGTPVTRSITTPTVYCSTGLGGSCGSAAITDVSILNTTLSNLAQSPPCSGGYSNFPATGNTTATLLPGTSYQLSVKIFNITTSDNVTAWLDFNQNGLFEASEVIMPTGGANGNTPRVVSFSVPVGAVAGPTGLRLRSSATGSTVLAPGSACAQVLGSGETEDYTVTIGAPVACPMPTGLAVSNLSTTPTLTFNTVPGVASYTVTYSCYAGGPPIVFTKLVTAPPVQLTGLNAQAQCGVSVVANCGPGSASTPASLAFQTPINPPVNDECTAATMLTPGTNPQPANGSTNYGTVTTTVPTPPAACTTPVTQDVWYSFVATQPNHQVVVNIIENATVLVEAFAGNCGTFLRLGCQVQDANGGNQYVNVTLPLTGLAPGQTYYVRVGQAVNGTLAPQFNVSIQNPGPGYCTTNLGNSPTCAGPNMTSVAIAGTSLNNTNIQCAQSATIGYQEFASSGSTTASLTVGQTYQLQTALSSGATDVSLWVDYNQNFLFEPAEHVQVGLNASGSATASFTVPAGTPVGTTRLRLRTRAAGAGNGPADACTNFGGSGETQDYTVTLVSGSTSSMPCFGPSTVNVGSLTPTTATVSFPIPTGSTGLVVQYQTAGQALQTVSPAPTASPVQLTGLTPGRSYTVCVSSSCAGGTPYTTCSTPFTLPSPPCLAPTNVVATPTPPNSVSISFTPPAGSVVASYTATATPTNGGAPVTVMGSTASPILITNLLPGVSYTVTVATSCAGGSSSPASTPSAPFVILATRSAWAAQVSLHPNPAHGTAMLTLPARREAGGLTLLNALGQNVRQQALPAAATQVELPLTGLPAGVYTLQLRTGQEVISKRLVVE